MELVELALQGKRPLMSLEAYRLTSVGRSVASSITGPPARSSDCLSQLLVKSEEALPVLDSLNVPACSNSQLEDLPGLQPRKQRKGCNKLHRPGQESHGADTLFFLERQTMACNDQGQSTATCPEA